MALPSAPVVWLNPPPENISMCSHLLLTTTGRVAISMGNRNRESETMSSWKDKHEAPARDVYIVCAIAIAAGGYDFFIEEIPLTTYRIIVLGVAVYLLFAWCNRLSNIAKEAEERIRELEWWMGDTRSNYEQKDLEPIRFEDDPDYDPDTD